MALWVVRAGRNGEQQETALKEGLVCHGWNELPDYSTFRTREELRDLYEKIYPRENKKQIIARLGQVWRFAREIQKGDLVALPSKTEYVFAFGRVTGDYQYKKVAQNVMHIRTVEWLKTVPTSALPKDILLSMRGMLAVFKVTRNDAERRVKKILGLSEDGTDTAEGEIEEITEDETVDLEEAARDEILKFIQAKFTGHDLARLVNAVLRAQGYKSEVSPPGPDGGVDILAASGPLGFHQPRLCVQVKSGSGAEGQKTFNELRGVVSKFGAEQGLLVSWGGFTNPVKQDARKDFFKIRLWDQGDLVDALLENYERLDDQIKGELPLRRIWVLVDDEAQ
ncbi:MAG: restriction endonuclease [Planctomycetes bacterium]|nr:restriction endonuclease [Planctomycetota bacterium]